MLSPVATLARGNAPALGELLGLLIRYRHLTWEMAKREISDRYAGQVLGAAWAVGHPLVLMAVYVFVFRVVFNLKVGGTYELPLDYTSYLLAGLIPWMACQESMAKGASAVVSNTSLVKQVVFPVEVLPVKSVLSSLVTQIIATAILIMYVLFTNGSLPFTYALLPVAIAMQLMLMIGVDFILAAVAVYLRDVKDLVQVFLTVGMYIMPVFYLPEWTPDLFKGVLYINPFSYMVFVFQDVLYFGRFEHPYAWPVFAIESLVILVLGYRLFRRLKFFFGSAL
jgi:homopolymeric O-antigen transport system permease protein